MLRFIFLSIAFFPLWAYAQLPPACGGTATVVACEQVCISCNFDGYFGSTEGYPSGPAVSFCGTIENAQWMGFIAGAIEATFTITPSNCSNGNGVQVALYEDCTRPPLACNKGQEKGGNKPVSIKVPLTPGHNYFLLIDGYAGDQCDFSVSVTPKEAVYEPPLGMVQANIVGKTEGCPGATFTYQVPPVFGASAYIWDGPPGTLVNGDSVPVTVLASQQGNQVQVTLGQQSGNLCVQAANSCNRNPPCSGSLYIKILDDSHRPTLVTDTVVGIGCIDGTARLHVDVLPPVNYTYQWTPDSSGRLLSGEKTRTARTDQPGTYTFTATAVETGCSSSIAVRVGEPELPDSIVIAIRHISCYGKGDGYAEITHVSGGAPPYLYAIDGSPFQNVTQFRRLTPGEHRLTIQAFDGCEKDTVITVLEPADLVLDLPPDTTIHLGDRIHLWRDDALSDPTRRKQTFVSAPLTPDMLCDTCQYLPLKSFRYEVTVLDSNGCRAHDARTIVVETDRRVYIPNAVAPAGGTYLNTGLRMSCGPDVALVRSFRLFNRWGHVIVERRNFMPSDAEPIWDGLVNGERVPPSVYAYIAEIEFIDGQVEFFSGDVTLVR